MTGSHPKLPNVPNQRSAACPPNTAQMRESGPVVLMPELTELQPVVPSRWISRVLLEVTLWKTEQKAGEAASESGSSGRTLTGPRCPSAGSAGLRRSSRPAPCCQRLAAALQSGEGRRTAGLRAAELPSCRWKEKDGR